MPSAKPGRGRRILMSLRDVHLRLPDPRVGALFATREVLHGVDLDIKKGEVLGLIGRNGAGKSVLCKLLAGVYTPSSGSFTRRTRDVAMISMDVGLRPRLTARQNISLYASLRGLSKPAEKTLIAAVEEKSGLGDWLDRRIEHYSSGMRARLAFIIALSSPSELIIIDEALAAGDAEFRLRAQSMLAELLGGDRTAVIVSHNTNFMLKNCTRLAVLDGGRVTNAGATQEVMAEYLGGILGLDQAADRLLHASELRDLEMDEIVDLLIAARFAGQTGALPEDSKLRIEKLKRRYEGRYIDELIEHRSENRPNKRA